MYTTLITPTQLHELQSQGKPLMVFDCSFDLMQPDLGVQQYLEAHVPGALYVDLDTYLSSSDPDNAASGGRHPLPVRSDCVHALRRVGFANDMQAVVYDRSGNNYCGRLWWIMKWLGHDNVAVLDGGLTAWQEAGYPVESGPHPISQQMESGAYAMVDKPFELNKPLVRLVSTDEVAQSLGKGECTLIDSRAAARYSGEEEMLDPVAGHIPGALNRPYAENMDASGRLKPAEVLRQEFEALLAGRDASRVTVYCGSGVSAIPNVLAMEIAGLPRPALYGGSWSEWCTTKPELPVERG